MVYITAATSITLHVHANHSQKTHTHTQVKSLSSTNQNVVKSFTDSVSKVPAGGARVCHFEPNKYKTGKAHVFCCCCPLHKDLQENVTAEIYLDAGNTFDLHVECTVHHGSNISRFPF